MQGDPTTISLPPNSNPLLISNPSPPQPPQTTNPGASVETVLSEPQRSRPRTTCVSTADSPTDNRISMLFPAGVHAGCVCVCV